MEYWTLGGADKRSLGKGRAIHVPVDNQGRMKAVRIPAIKGPTIVWRCCSNARRFADRPRDGGFDILNGVVLHKVPVSFGDLEVVHETYGDDRPGFEITHFVFELKSFGLERRQ